MKGNVTFDGRGSPHLKSVMMNVASQVENPHNPDEQFASVLDNWVDKSPNSRDGGETPIFNPVGSGSDFRPFAQIPGMANVDMRYKGDRYSLLPNKS